MMEKRILSSIILIIFLIVSYLYLDKVFASSHRYVNTIEDFNELSKRTDIDIIFYGTSHAYTCYNPLVINKITKTISYNLGSDALLMSLTDLVLEESLKKAKPKLIILEVYKGTITTPTDTKKSKGYQLRALDLVSNFSFKKHKEVAQIFNKGEYLGALSPLIRNHKEWNNKKYFSFSKRVDFTSEDFYYGGYVGYGKRLDKSLYNINFNNFRTRKIKSNPQDTILNIKIRNNIKEFIRIANQNNISVLAVTSPDLRVPFENYYLYEEFEDFFNKMNIPYLNLNDYYNELDLTVNDFRDPGHLNRYGGYKSSLFLANYLKENYSFSDRSLEPIWKEENKKYENYLETYRESVFKKELQIQLTEDIIAEDIKVTRTNEEYIIELNLNGSEHLDLYNLSAKITPYNIEELSEYSKSKQWVYDKKDLKLTTSKSLIKIKLITKIKEIKELELFLYNTEKYKGVIGNKIIINDIPFRAEK